MMFDNNFTGSDVAETFYAAHSFALKRTGIYEKMRNNTVRNEDAISFQIAEQDIISAIKKISMLHNQLDQSLL